MSTPAKAKEKSLLSSTRDAKLVYTEESPTQNERFIATKIQQLSDTLSQLNIHNTMWVTKAGLKEEQLNSEMYSVTWLESKWGDVDDFQDRIDELNLSNTLRSTHTDADYSMTINNWSN